MLSIWGTTDWTQDPMDMMVSAHHIHSQSIRDTKPTPGCMERPQVLNLWGTTDWTEDLLDLTVTAHHNPTESAPAARLLEHGHTGHNPFIQR